MQHVGDITETSFPVQYGLDLLGWAKGGIKTGELTVIRDIYKNYDSDFEKQRVNTSITSKESATFEYQKIKKYGIYSLKINNSSTIQIYDGYTLANTLSVKINEGQIEITNISQGLLTVNEISKFSTQQSTSKKIFKADDLIVPCKDYNYNPIISDSDGNPVIYKVVEATTYGEGGAVFQDLKVRQVKVKKAEELPYYLVANDTGITICIRENGYATEGSNNQIIQIAWQT